jgi:hypothetical protein
MGRRAIPDSTAITIKVPRATLEGVERVADEEFCNRATALRLILERGLRARREGDDR